MSTFVSVYAIAIGCLVTLMWTGSLASGKVPELATEPRAIRLHLAAEGMLAITLVGGGVMSLAGVAEGPYVVLLGFGMTLYSIVNSMGYFLQRRELRPIVMFSALFITTAVTTAAALSAFAR